MRLGSCPRNNKPTHNQIRTNDKYSYYCNMSEKKGFIEGFSRKNRDEKIRWLKEHYGRLEPQLEDLLSRYRHSDARIEDLHEHFIENTLSNYWLPYAVAPNFRINDTVYTVPMVTEESSVVAAAAKGAKFWFEYGGFKAKVVDTIKYGHIHFLYRNNPEKLRQFVKETVPLFLERLKPFTRNMEERGGGILSVDLEDYTDKLTGYYSLRFRFKTADSMGANFINTILEEWADYMEESYAQYGRPEDLEIIMRILSNHNPECRVRVEAEASVEDLAKRTGMKEYATKLKTAFDMARVNPYRAVTHNKGIMNGVDAVILATGNDFRAVEAGAHAYACGPEGYTALSRAEISGGKLRLMLEIPLTVGTVGGMTRLHPLADLSMKILGNPGAETLMQIVASVGLAQNFSAVHSLVTEGIQKGHMKMHLNNILLRLGATPEEAETIRNIFRDRKAHVHSVKEALDRIRNRNNEQNRLS